MSFWREELSFYKQHVLPKIFPSDALKQFCRRQRAASMLGRSLAQLSIEELELLSSGHHPVNAQGGPIIDQRTPFYGALESLFKAISGFKPNDQIYFGFGNVDQKTSAGILLINQDKVLLQRRKQDQINPSAAKPEKWAFTGGGFVSTDTIYEYGEQHVSNINGYEILNRKMVSPQEYKRIAYLISLKTKEPKDLVKVPHTDLVEAMLMANNTVVLPPRKLSHAQAVMQHAKSKSGITIEIPPYGPFETITKEPYDVRNQADVAGTVLRYIVPANQVFHCVRQAEAVGYETAWFTPAEIRQLSKNGDTSLSEEEIGYLEYRHLNRYLESKSKPQSELTR